MVNGALIVIACVLTLVVVDPGRLGSFALREAVLVLVILIALAVLNVALLRPVFAPLQVPACPQDRRFDSAARAEPFHSLGERGRSDDVTEKGGDDSPLSWSGRRYRGAEDVVEKKWLGGRSGRPERVTAATAEPGVRTNAVDRRPTGLEKPMKA